MKLTLTDKIALRTLKFTCPKFHQLLLDIIKKSKS
jgi:hypothetical protein